MPEILHLYQLSSLPNEEAIGKVLLNSLTMRLFKVNGTKELINKLHFLQENLEVTILRYMQLNRCNKSKSKCEQGITYIYDNHEANPLKVIVSYHVTLSSSCHYLNNIVERVEVFLNHCLLIKTKYTIPCELIHALFYPMIYEKPKASCPMPQQKEYQNCFTNIHENTEIFHVYFKLLECHKKFLNC